MLFRSADYQWIEMFMRGHVVSLETLMRGSAAANGHHDFDFVAIGERLVGMSPARHDLTVAFKRHAFAGQTQRGNQPGAGERR